jgi:hypothetical protein
MALPGSGKNLVFYSYSIPALPATERLFALAKKQMYWYASIASLA